MKLFLQLKHWQLFVITWGVPILIGICAVSNPMPMISLFPVMMVVIIIGVFGWIYSIATVLHKKLPPDTNLKLSHFKLTLLVPVLYMIGLLVWIDFQSFQGESGSGESIGLTIAPAIIVLHLLSMVCIFLGLRFAAKTMKSLEIGRRARFSDYSGEFFLIWFSPIGVWILQPRLNKISA